MPDALMEEMKSLIKEFNAVLPKLEWKEFTTDLEAGAQQFVGKGEDWTVTVLTHLDLEGNPRFDGSAGKTNTLIHLPSELAEKTFKLAYEWAITNKRRRAWG